MNAFVINNKLKRIYTDQLPVPVQKGSDMFFGVQDEDIPVGVAAIRAEGSSFFLTYIFIREEYRHRGAGTLLMGSVKSLLREIGADSLETTYTLNDSTAVLHDFLEEMQMGDEPGCEMPVMEFRLGDIPDSYRGKSPKSIISLQEVSNTAWGKYMTEYQKYRDETSEPMPDFREKDYYDPGLSFVCLDDQHKITGSILFSGSDSDRTLEHLACIQPNSTSVIRALIFAAINKADSFMDKDALIKFCAFDSKTLSLADTICGGRVRQIGVSMTQVFEF